MNGWKQHFDKIKLYYHNKDVNCISEIAIGIETLLREYSNNTNLNFAELINHCLFSFSKKEDIHNIRKVHNEYKHEDGITRLKEELQGDNFYLKYVLPTNEMILFLQNNGYEIKYFINLDFLNNDNYYDSIENIKYNSGYFSFNRVFILKNIKTCDKVINPIIAVIHNILSIGPAISKSEYIKSLNLKYGELEIVYQFEVLLLNILSNIDLKQKLNFQTSANNSKYLIYALENINYFINLFKKLTIVDTIKFEILSENEKAEFRYITFTNECYEIEIENDYDTSYQNKFMFSKNAINYHVDEASIKSLNKITTLIFGHNNLRDGQKDALIDILNNCNDKKYVSLSIMPTGYGKSLVYQLISILHPIKSIVVSPTDILIEDQIINAYENNIYAFGKFEKHYLYSNSKLLYYATPNQIQDGNLYSKFIQSGVTNDIGFLFFDEVHQLSIWGHKFDPSFLSLTNYLVRVLQNVTIACFTATATRKTIVDLKDKIQWHNVNVLQPCSMIRKNIKHSFIKLDNLDEIILSLKEKLKTDLKSDGLIMIINNNHKILKKIYESLQSDHYLSSMVQLFEKYNRYEYEAFRSGIIRIILSSDDFTVGINVKNLKKIYTIGLPCSKEWYYQETGRVCRTDDNCESIVYLIKNLSIEDLKFFDMNVKYKDLNNDDNSYSLMIANNQLFFNEFRQINDVKHELINLIEKLDVFNRCERLQYETFYRYTKIRVDKEKYDYTSRAILFLQLLGFVSYWNYDISEQKSYFSIYFKQYLNYAYFIQRNTISFDKTDYRGLCQKAINFKDAQALTDTFVDWFCNNVYLSKRLLVKNVYEMCERCIKDKYYLDQLEDDLYSYFVADLINVTPITQDSKIIENKKVIDSHNDDEITIKTIEYDFSKIDNSFTIVMFRNKYQRLYERKLDNICIVALLIAELATKKGKLFFNTELLQLIEENQVIGVFNIIKNYFNHFNLNKVVELLSLLTLNEKLINEIYQLNISGISNVLLLSYLNTMEE